MGVDFRGQLRRMQDQLASTSAANHSVITRPPPDFDSQGPSVRAISIDGIAESRDEDLIKKCQDRVFFHMGLNYSEYHIEECFRIGWQVSTAPATATQADLNRPAPPPGRPRTVYVKFNMVSARESVLKRRFNLRNKRVYVNEYHPWEIEEDRRRMYPIMRKARSLQHYRNKIELVANKIILEGTSYGVEDFAKLPADLDPRHICTERIGEVTYFFKCDSPLSNHHPCKFTIDNVEYNCSEQAYFHKKATVCGNTDAAADIMKCTRPKVQKSMGSAIISTEDWEGKRVQVMTNIVTEKFQQNPHLMAFLNDTTGTSYIAEDSPTDSFFGLGVSRNHHDRSNLKGIVGNHMGKILMLIRDNAQQRPVTPTNDQQQHTNDQQQQAMQ